VLVARGAAALEGARREIENRYHVSICTDAGDLSDDTNVTRLSKLFPNVDILVNNAGAIPIGTLFEVDEARWRTAWDLKVLGTINMTRAFYPLMKAGRRRYHQHHRSCDADPNFICGVTGNAGLTAFTEAIGAGACATASASLASALVRRRPTGCWLAPTRWRGSGSAIPFVGRNFTRPPAGRVSEPAEIAAMVCFLASPKSNYTSGVVITLDAGISSRAGSH
jgi:3-oxoacyl-[acyl-carrier protein] reductase